ncbi:MAG: hypothetical protein IJB88_06920 [Clostridia bacterium]|nr:hypothetical protein [Clostridia bacterium]
MNYFETFSSNTIAGIGNQFYFGTAKDEIRFGRMFYKITVGGTYRYSLLFTNTIDSTYALGDISQKNLVCKPWTIHRARIGRAGSETFATDAMHHNDSDVFAWCDLTFDGCTSKEVASGETFWNDPIELTFDKDEYLCLEIAFSGEMIPYHEESLLPIFICQNGEWKYDRKMPLAGMVGCDRKINHRITFWGDSITQGIGTPNNSYAHWNALVANKLDKQYACWNIGIGYARANDAATLDAWWKKAKHSDTVVLCLGANDILQYYPEDQLLTDLQTIVHALKQQGIRIVLQTVPPFEYNRGQIEVWKRVNDFIRGRLAKEADLFFDVVPLLSEGEPDHLPKYGGHPNAEGCRIWADALYKQLENLL